MTDLYSSIGMRVAISFLSFHAAAGLGFGVIHCVLLYGTILASSLGPGTFYADHCPQMSTFVVSGALLCYPTVGYSCISPCSLEFFLFRDPAHLLGKGFAR